jgi:LPXTG-site transpeptidase (sortase) family protein
MVRSALLIVFVLAAAMCLHLVLVSSLVQRSAQQQLLDRFRAELAQGTAPVGPTDTEGDVLPVGTPVAYLEIPSIDVEQVVVSGTSSSALFAGPGHRRDSVLPGQAGASVIMGRSAAYGGPFADIDNLERGDRIEVTTGQGEFTYEVLGVRREGDRLPAPLQDDESRLVLTAADGNPFLPSGVVRVDAAMDEDAPTGPGRLFPADALPAAERTMAGDTSELWALAFWLQAFVLLAVGAVWAWHRWGHPQAWIAFLPPLLLVGIGVANQAASLLPNML